MRGLGAAFLGKGTLPIRVRELVILRTCARCGCAYEWGVHAAAFGAIAGLDERAIAATWADPPGEDAVLRAVVELHDAGTVGDATWAELAARFDEPQLLELLALAGFYHLISFVANGARLSPEPFSAGAPSARAG
jgi:alkylhydroperoxidase family enzyme